MGYGYVYRTTNLGNGRLYIGRCKGEFNSSYLGSGLLLSKAITKYGVKSFKVEVIATAEDKDKLNELERVYIAEYRRIFGKDMLYNITDGGAGGSASTVTHRSECQCIPCRSKRGETKGINNPMFGKKREYRRHRENCQCYFCRAHRGETRGIAHANYGKFRGIPLSARGHRAYCVCVVCREVKKI